MAAYYNEHDPYAAQWLRNLIAAGHIAPGDVDERSIEDVRPDDLVGYRQCHFFAGIGVWSYALRLAGWPDDREVWTGSCPCQPFSSAGKGDGFADERHLWPAFFHLIGGGRPVTLFGEQVASKGGLAWLDTVCADLEGAGYSVGANDLCVAGFGAPGIRQRLFFVADADAAGRSEQWSGGLSDDGDASRGHDAHGCGDSRELADAESGDGPREQQARGTRSGRSGLAGDGAARRVVDAEFARLEGHAGYGDDRNEPGRLGTCATRSATTASGDGSMGDSTSGGCREQWGEAIARRYGHPDLASRNSAVRGFWNSADWVLCRDPRGPKWRPVESGSFPLATRTPTRVGQLRAYGNAINAEVARAFIEASMT